MISEAVLVCERGDCGQDAQEYARAGGHVILCDGHAVEAGLCRVCGEDVGQDAALEIIGACSDCMATGRHLETK